MNTHAQTRDAVLTQKEAETRAQQIGDVEYKMYFRLPEKDPNYTGEVEVTLHVKPEAARIADKIFLDFSGGGEIKSLHLNGMPIEFKYNGSRISIPTGKFTNGRNVLSINFSHPYNTSGMGFHRTQDHADGKYYMYSNFEPFHANKAFPLFDQPDLKAMYTLTVDVPATWQAISNTLETQVSSAEDGYRRWVFPTSAKFSSYLFALIAGPYKSWSSKTDSGVPLRLFARESMAQYLTKDGGKDVEHWFQVTNEGFKFFEKAFGYPYPFGKYDQILTPDYNQGAMENVGAVTFTERYIFRTQVTPLQVLNRAETIVHELAHMWFGNLVTMKWWDDLWLNESFATYVSNLAMSKFQDKISSANVWQNFHARNKEWAYREDDFVTTHPIVGQAADTEEAIANFDGITYGKGASVLKQLVHYIGEDAFLSGLKEYFKKYAYKNATRSDFLNALSKSSKKDLVAWENEWFMTSGTNSIEAVLMEKSGRLQEVVLKQFPDEADRQLRTHRTELGFYDLKDGEIVLREKTVNVAYSGRETRVAEVAGQLMPAFVFPNVGDQDFVHVVLDPKSVATLEGSLRKIVDPHLRQMLWSTLWNMVRHAKLPAQRFAQIAMANLESEKDLGVITSGMDYLIQTFWYMNPDLKRTDQDRVEKFILGLFRQAEAGSPKQIALFSRFVRMAYSAESLSMLKGWLSHDEASEIAPGFKMDQERRWTVITQLARKGMSGASEIIRAEALKDQNDKGVLSAMVAEVSLPHEESKQAWWNRILGRDQSFGRLSIEKARAVMSVFHDFDNLDVTRFMADLYFEELPKLSQQFPDEFNSSFAAQMIIPDCNEGMIRKLSSFLEENPSLQVAVKRELLKARQLYQRTMSARALSSQSLAG